MISKITTAVFNPASFKKHSKIFLPWLTVAFIITFCYGLYLALIASPEDYLQGDLVRIMYVHVPAAWISLGAYSFIAILSLLTIVWRLRLAYIIAYSAAPIGAMFAFVTLVTGSIWGKPAWGTWWVWDARLTSMFILFLFYITYIAVSNAGSNFLRAEKPASIIAILGIINVPIVKFSVELWSSIHQNASISIFKGSAIDSTMLPPLIVMFIAFGLYFLIMLIIRTNNTLRAANL